MVKHVRKTYILNITGEALVQFLVNAIEFSSDLVHDLSSLAEVSFARPIFEVFVSRSDVVS